MAEPTEEELLVEVKKLEPRAIFGLNGQVDHATHVHPDKEHLVFPVGNKICIEHLKTHRQEFLEGHNHNVQCSDFSKR